MLKESERVEQGLVLQTMRDHPDYSLSEIAKHLDWVTRKRRTQQTKSPPADVEAAEGQTGGAGFGRGLQADPQRVKRR